MENTVRYSFSYYTPLDMIHAGTFPVQSSSQKNITMDDATAWPAIVREFTNFLSGIYGYDISAKVFVQDINWDSTDVEYTSIQDYV